MIQSPPRAAHAAPRLARAAGILACTLLAGACHRIDHAPEVARLGYHHEMVSLDPHAHNESVTGAVLSAVYEPLVTVAPGRGPQACLAVEWSNPEPSVWRFTLRQGVLFHDGRPLTPDDVLASFQRVRQDIGLAVATYLEPIAEVRRVPGAGDVIEVVTHGPSPLLLNRLAMIAIAPQYLDPHRPVGTGPFEWRSGRERGPVVLRRWERYWGEPAAMKEVRIRFIPDTAVLEQLLEAHELDVMSGASLDFISDHVMPAGWSVVRIPSVGTTLLGMNVSRPPLEELEVRRAIDLAIDRKAMVAECFGEDRAEVALSLVPREVAGFSAGNRQPTGQPARARELLDEAGVAAGARLQLQNIGSPQCVVDRLVGALEEIGFEVEPTETTYESSYRRFTTAQTELFLFGWNFRFPDPSDFLDSIVHSRDHERRLGLFNGAGYSVEEVDRWIDALNREPDAGRRQQLLDDTLARVNHDRPYIPLYHHSRFALVREGFRLHVQPGLWVLPQSILVRDSQPAAAR